MLLAKKLRRIVVICTLAFFSTHVSAEEVVVPFRDGVFGTGQGSTIVAEDITKFSTYNLSASFFAQTSTTSQFVAGCSDGGNDVGGSLRIRAGGYITDIPGCITGKYRTNTGGNTAAFHFKAWDAASSTYANSITYKAANGSSVLVSSNVPSPLPRNKTAADYPLVIAVLMNGFVLDDLVSGTLANGDNLSGNSSGVITDLNNYLALAVTNAPSGPITVDPKFYLTTDTPKLVTGSATLQVGESVTVIINNTMYELTGLGTGAITWSLDVSSLAAGTYDVDAWIVNNGNWLLQDSTNGELVISATAPTVPLLNLTKTLPANTSLDDGAAAGDTIQYTITAKNIGTVSALNFNLVDALSVSTSSTTQPRTPQSPDGLSTVSCTGGSSATDLEPSETCTWTYSYTLVSGDLSYTNIGNIAELHYSAGGIDYVLQSSATGKTSSGTPTTGVTSTPIAGTTITNTTGVYSGTLTSRALFVAAPALEVTKVIDTTTSVSGKTRIASNSVVDMDGNGFVNAGDRVYFTITAENTGNVNLTSVSLSGDLLKDNSGNTLTMTLPTKSGDTGLITSDSTMDQGDIWTYGGYYTLTSSDVISGGIMNLATMSATGGGSTFSVESSSSGNSTTGTGNGAATAITFAEAPRMTVTKTANTSGLTSPAAIGQTITYTITVNNSGNVPLTNVSLTDALTSDEAYVSGDAGVVSTLDVGETWTYSASYTLTQADLTAGQVQNLAVATATPPSGAANSFSVESSSTGNMTAGTGNGTTTDTVLVAASSVTVDTDGDGKDDSLESSTADRDGDGIPDAQDYDPQGYFYCQEDGAILTGGRISVSGPAGSNSALGTLNGINIIKDGSEGNYQFTVSNPGTYTMTITYPSGGVPSTTHVSSGALTLASIAHLGNPASIGHSEYGSTGIMSNFKDSDTTNDTPTAFYTTFVIASGDPYLIGNNIPMQNCSGEALIEEVNERAGDIITEDFRRTVEMQQESISGISRSALFRLQDGYEDLPCGDVEEFDVDGVGEVANGEGIISGTFGQDFNNCVKGERRIDEGEFSITSTKDVGVESMLNLRRQWERLVDEDEVRGKFVGGYVSNSTLNDGNGLTGSTSGFGLNAGLYGAFTEDKEIFVDYYLAGAIGLHTFDLGFSTDLGAVTANGEYIYGALFGGAAVSGSKDMGDYSITPRAGFDVAIAKASGVTVKANRLNLTANGTIAIPQHSLAKAYAEAIFSFGEDKPENATKDVWSYDIAPRFFCEVTSRSTNKACGWGGYFDAEYYSVEDETDFGVRIDVSGNANGNTLSIALREETVILDGAGSVTSTIGSDTAGAINVGSAVEVRF